VLNAAVEPPAASLALEKMGIPHHVFRHVRPVETLEQAARERGQSPGQVVRSIVFRLGKGEFVMVLAAGPAQISWPALRSYLGRSRISMAVKEEVLAATGYRIGAVSPFGLPAPLRTLADEAVFVPEDVSLGSGVRGVAIIMKSGDLRRALGDVEVGKFVQDE
jgi:prolyl-tRNA editing enzyme YbaK/EbsC (Cys-tRNA(Pro) deacylase)